LDDTFFVYVLHRKVEASAKVDGIFVYAQKFASQYLKVKSAPQTDKPIEKNRA